MTPKKAAGIIDLYRAALRKGVDGEIARKISLLPCSKCKIRYAYYFFVEHEILHGIINDELENQLIITYAAIDKFITDDEAEAINTIYKKIRDGIKVNSSEADVYSGFYRESFCPNPITELREYINECKQNK